VIELNWTLWLQFVNFFVLMAVLNFLLYRPIRDLMTKRKGMIEGDHNRAGELEEQVSAKVEKYQEQLQEAKQKGSQEKTELRRIADKEGSEILGEARGAAADQLNEIRNKIGADAEEARKALKGEVQTLATMVASKVLGRQVG